VHIVAEAAIHTMGDQPERRVTCASSSSLYIPAKTDICGSCTRRKLLVAGSVPATDLRKRKRGGKRAVGCR
jgi:hypothetical protein